MNSVSFIPYGLETIALCAAPPDWSDPLKLDIFLPGDVTASLLKSESRRRFSTSQRYDLTHKFTSDNAADSNDLRQWLNRLKIETVAAPLWCDEVLLSAPCSIGATSLQIAGSELPVRYGAEWLIVDDAGLNFEIVVVTGLTTGTVTIASPGTEFAWAGGTALYPLLFGRLTDRPQITAISDEASTCELKFHESSPFARKLNPRFMPASLMGAHGGEFSLYKLWTIEPNWVEPRDWTESDVLRHQIPSTIAREEQQYQYQNWNRRGLEMEFLCSSRDEIAAIEYFFNERKATSASFFIPTFRGDLRLAADIAPNAATFQIETSRYEDPAYDQIPGSAVLALIDLKDGFAASVFPQRITLVNSTTITPIIPVGEAHAKDTTLVSFCMLVRFLEQTLSWEYTSDGLAKCRLKFLELPSEYVTPAPAISPPAYLFHFQEKTPTPNNWYYTSYEEQLVYAGHTYTPAPFSFGRYSAKKDLSDSLELTSFGGSFAGNPLNAWLPFTLNAPMTLTITRVNRDAPDDGKARILFFGDVMNLDTTGPDWKSEVKFFGRRLEMKFPRFNFQLPDNYTQFTPPTQLSDATFKKTGTLATLTGFTITVTGRTEATDWWSNGRLETGTGANFERRSILSSTLGGLTTLIIDRPLIHAVVGQSLTLWPGYDQTREQCQTKFNNNINFGGHPFMPLTNPTLKTQDIQTPTGGKK